MAINLGNEVTQAIHDLRGNHAFERVINMLGVIAQDRVLQATKSPVDDRINQTAYALGVWEVWEELMKAYQGVTTSRDIKKPAQPKVGANAA